MLNWIDRKYATLFGNTHLEKYKVKRDTPYLSSFRCPECGDSERNPNKTRGYFFEADDAIIAKCHNCGWSSSLMKVMQRYSPAIAEEYNLEKFREKIKIDPTPSYVSDITKTPLRRINKFDPFKDCKKISQLDKDHIAKKYVENRKIPEKYHFTIYYTDSFTNLVNSITKDKISEKLSNKDESRVIFPLITEDGYVFGFVGRAINKNTSLRYLTEIFDTSKKKLFGMDRIDRSKLIKVFEGPIDALCMDNSIALCGTDGALDYVSEKSGMVVILDNQPRNREVVNRYKSLIANNYTVVIWPENWKYKDVNEAIIDGVEPIEIEDIITRNRFRGLEAQLRLAQWKKI